MEYGFLFLFVSAFAVSAALSIFITPFVKRFAAKHKFLDSPSERKVHKTPVPLGGGVAVYLSFFLTIFLILLCALVFVGKENFPFEPIKILRQFLGLLGCATIILIMGVFDDKKALPAKFKLLVQICLALVLYYFGFSIDFISLPSIEIFYLTKGISLALTLLWIVGLTNALNFLDGLDGLLAGVTVISSISFAVITASQGQFLVTVLMLILAGSCFGFLKYNFHPAKIFLGDSGSLFIGLMLSSLSIMGAFKVTATLVFLVPLIIMGIPIFDTTYAVTRRVIKGQSVFKPDRGHLHHKLLDMGLSQSKVVITIYIINGLLCAFSIYLAFMK